MLAFFSYIDTSLFLAINHLPHTALSDLFFSGVSAAGYLGIGWLIIGSVWLLWKERRDHPMVMALVVAVVLAVIITDTMKPLVGRLRPAYTVVGTIEVAGRTETYAFPSGHTAVAIAAAYVLRRGRKPMPAIIWLVACLVAFSRIYLGKHFPSDIVSGALIGWLVGFGVHQTQGRLFPPKNPLRSKRDA